MKQQTTITFKITNKETESFKKYLKDVASTQLLTPAEELILGQKASTGDQAAIDELVRRNLRFVISVAKQYANSNNPIEDLVNEGNIGLILAASKFDPKMGFRFISYAVWWVRKIILEYISKNGKAIRLPSNKINLISKLDKDVAMLEQKLGYNASIHDLLGELGDTIDMKELSMIDSLSNMTIDSLDREISNGDSSTLTLGEIIADESNPEADSGLIETDIKTQIGKLVGTLKPRDERIMIALFGLDGQIPMTMKEIGDEVGITREMVRQIREKSLKKFRFKLKGSSLITCQ